jgi:hypothetical protein
MIDAEISHRVGEARHGTEKKQKQSPDKDKLRTASAALIVPHWPTSNPDCALAEFLPEFWWQHPREGCGNAGLFSKRG